MTVSLDDMARWFPGTNVVWDMLLEAGFQFWSVEPRFAVAIDLSMVRPYSTRTRFMDRDWYTVWSGQEPAVALNFNDSMREAALRECPLYGCEGFDMRQREVPIAHQVPKGIPIPGRPGEYWVPLSETLARENGFGFFGTGDADTARSLAAAINAPPRLMTIGHADVDFGLDPDTTVSWRAATYRTPRRPKPSRVPDVVELNRRRLDGRRFK